MAKRLELKFAIGDADAFEVGRNCDDIRRIPGAFEVVSGKRLLILGDHLCGPFTQEDRQGLAQEPVEEALPGYVKKLEGKKPWGCGSCKQAFGTLHGLKSHYGRMHEAT